MCATPVFHNPPSPLCRESTVCLHANQVVPHQPSPWRRLVHRHSARTRSSLGRKWHGGVRLLIRGASHQPLFQRPPHTTLLFQARGACVRVIRWKVTQHVESRCTGLRSHTDGQQSLVRLKRPRFSRAQLPPTDGHQSQVRSSQAPFLRILHVVAVISLLMWVLRLQLVTVPVCGPLRMMQGLCLLRRFLFPARERWVVGNPLLECLLFRPKECFTDGGWVCVSGIRPQRP